MASIVEQAARGERFLVTLYDRDRCAIVSTQDLQRLEELDAAGKARPKEAKRRRP